MADKPRGLDQLSTSDQAIYDYLDDMFREPDLAQESESVTRESLSTELSSNQTLSDQTHSNQTASILKAVPQHFAEPARLHINPNIMTLQAFKERPPQSLIPSPIIVPMPANELMQPEPDSLDGSFIPVEDLTPEEPIVEKPIAEKPIAEKPVIKELAPEEKVIKDLVLEKTVVEKIAVEKPAVETPAAESLVVQADVTPIKTVSVTSKEIVPDKPEDVTVVNPADIEVETEQVLSVHLPPMEEWHSNGRPEWAQERFECLIFNVSGLKLAVPLVTLGAIHQIDKKFNLLPGQDDWFIGILRTPTGNINVIDTALCVMPERYKPEDREGLKFVISLHGYEWGLACHEVSNSITLNPDEVRWRTQRGKRPWLAGTVVDHMCALIDTDGFHRVIEKAEKK